MAECMFAMAFLSVAAAALLLDASGLITTTDSAMQQTVALGMAQQLLDELSGMRYMEVGASPTSATLGPESNDAGPGWSGYDDIDDFNGLRAQPPTDRWAIALGNDNDNGYTRDPSFACTPNYLSRFHQQVDVFYVQSSALTTPTSTPTYYRAAKVQILYDDPKLGTQSIISLQRVFSYVPGS